LQHPRDVPSITLALTGQKTTGFAKSAGLSEFIIDEQNMNAKSIIHTTHLLWKNINQTRSKLQKEIPKLKTLASDSINRLTQEILT
jgi:polysaccharide pyruvyl transferase WcaK-like protein